MTKNQADNINTKLKTQSAYISELKAKLALNEEHIKTLTEQYTTTQSYADSIHSLYAKNIDTVARFKKHIYELCSDSIWGASGLIIYRRNFTDTNLYVINLADYNMTMKSVYNWAPYGYRNKVTLIPVRNNKRWKMDVPFHQDLGWHMYPYDGICGKNKKLNW